MIPPTSIDGTDITGATIDGTDVQEITVDGDVVFSAIQTPQAGLLHQWDFSAASTTTSFVEDLAGSVNLNSGNGFTNLSNTINGLQVGLFDGVDDFLKEFYTLNQPVERFIVLQMQSYNTDSTIILDGGSDSQSLFTNKGGSQNTGIFASALLEYNTDLNISQNYIMTGRYDGANSFVRENGVQKVSGNAGSSNAGGITVGVEISTSLLDRFANMFVGEILEYDPSATGFSTSAVENYLSSKWGISI